MSAKQWEMFVVKDRNGDCGEVSDEGFIFTEQSAREYARLAAEQVHEFAPYSVVKVIITEAP